MTCQQAYLLEQGKENKDKVLRECIDRLNSIECELDKQRATFVDLKKDYETSKARFELFTSVVFWVFIVHIGITVILLVRR